MSDVERRIRDALAEVDREDAGPGFHHSWNRASEIAGQRTVKRRMGGMVLVSMAGAAAAAVALVAVLSAETAPSGGPAEEAAAAKAGMEALWTPELTSLPSDGLAGPAVRAADVDRELLLAWNERMLGSETDWLLTLEIPAWGREGERKRP